MFLELCYGVHMRWQSRFDRLLKAMSQGEPHKAEKRPEKAVKSPETLHKPNEG
jgi:hypothetical protein